MGIEITKTPLKAATFNKYIMIYGDRLQSKSVPDLMLKYNMSRSSIVQIIRWAARYNDLSLGNKEQLSIAKDKAEERIVHLREESDTMGREIDLSTHNRYTLKLQYEKEIRANEELICKLNGLLKIDLTQYIDKRSVTIIHNMDKKEGKKELTLNDDKFRI